MINYVASHTQRRKCEIYALSDKKKNEFNDKNSHLLQKKCKNVTLTKIKLFTILVVCK